MGHNYAKIKLILFIKFIVLELKSEHSMAKKNQNKPSSIMTIALLFLFIISGALFYLNGETNNRIDLLESSTQSLLARISELESRAGTLNSPSPTSISISDNAPSKISESADKLLMKTSFDIDGKYFCSEGEEDNNGNISTYEVLYFKGGVVTFYEVKKNTKLTTSTLAEGKGKYQMSSLDILATLSLSEGGTKIFNFKVAELSIDQKNIISISLSPEIVWSRSVCNQNGISF
ncbi:MAG: hypothetical protein CME60_04045 [Halobacteriovoraceae bacterium]|nr:hypothetical protein [Halobacteriovoraceae bacterium]